MSAFRAEVDTLMADIVSKQPTFTSEAGLYGSEPIEVDTPIADIIQEESTPTLGAEFAASGQNKVDTPIAEIIQEESTPTSVAEHNVSEPAEADSQLTANLLDITHEETTLTPGAEHTAPPPDIQLTSNLPDIIHVKIEETPSDGHCFIYALVSSLTTYANVSVTYENVKDALRNEILCNLRDYEECVAVSRKELVSQCISYFEKKSYKCDFVDLLPLLAANTFTVLLVICSATKQELHHCRLVQPTVLEPASCVPFVVLHFRSGHYSSTSLVAAAIFDEAQLFTQAENCSESNVSHVVTPLLSRSIATPIVKVVPQIRRECEDQITNENQSKSDGCLFADENTVYRDEHVSDGERNSQKEYSPDDKEDDMTNVSTKSLDKEQNVTIKEKSISEEGISLRHTDGKKIRNRISSSSSDESAMGRNRCCDLDSALTLVSPSRGSSRSPQVARSKHRAGKRVWDKVTYCPYCERPFKKLVRHLERFHLLEVDVSEALSHPKRSQRRKKLLGAISNRGNFLHNMKVLEKGTGVLVPKNRPRGSSSVSVSDYLPCETCKAFFSRKNLWKHVKACVPAEDRKKMKGRHVHSRSASLLPTSIAVSERFEVVLNRMKMDAVGMLVRQDALILDLGKQIFDRFAADEDKVEYVNNKMRELGHLVKELRKSNIPHLQSCFKPALFETVTNAVKVVAGFNPENYTYAKPSLALKLGYSLKKCVQIIKSQALRNGLGYAYSEAKEFAELLDSDWASEVSSRAVRTLYDRRMNKEIQIPLTKDIVKLHDVIHQEIQRCMHSLQEKVSASVWTFAAHACLASLIAFNRRRAGEMGKMLLTSLRYGNTTYREDCVRQSLSPFEQQLCKSLTRIEIAGKRGKTVPVLLTKAMKEQLNILVATREQAGVNSNNPFVFATVGDMMKRHIRGSDCLRIFAKRCNAERPSLLTSTNLRKHVAATSQVLNLRDHELDILAGFLGHDIRTHREYYRLPVDYLQVAKVSRILLAMERGSLAQFKGKSLDEMDVPGM
jgi:hypothetical protein